MALLAHWKLDENEIGASEAADSSGHANDHKFQTVSESGVSGWFHRRRRNQNGASLSNVLNNADFLITGVMTVMAWIRPIGADAFEWIVGCGNGASEVQADNVLWSLVRSTTNTFGMRWEQGAGVDVTALAPASTLDGRPYDEGVHIACIRSINGSNRDVKFVLNGVDVGSDQTGLTAPDGGASGLCESGVQPGGTIEEYEGDYWNVRVYDTAESVSNILAVYNAELAAAQRVAKYLATDPVVPAHIGEAGTLYSPRHTGTSLDQTERPRSGWDEVLE
jgi:hypothetical protein